jgi:ribosomal protein S18 acetylase RimI-like enzyme
VFEPRDRAAIRTICHQVGYMGEPASWYWRHAESFADIWTGYYVDDEPESLLVAELDGRVIGYLTGCVDSLRAPNPARAVTRAALRNALFVRPGTAGFLWRGARDSLFEDGVPSGELVDPRWPSHLHINLLPEARRLGAGTSLMRAWFTRLAKVRSPGCHLGTLFENRRGIEFFTRMGFEPHGEPQLTPGMRTPDGGRHHLQFMVRATSRLR